nr:MAG TPA: hypothetical protein [Caudovirales sp. ctNII2]
MLKSKQFQYIAKTIKMQIGTNVDNKNMENANGGKT